MWLLIGWQLCWQPIRSCIWKSWLVIHVFYPRIALVALTPGWGIPYVSIKTESNRKVGNYELFSNASMILHEVTTTAGWFLDLILILPDVYMHKIIRCGPLKLTSITTLFGESIYFAGNGYHSCYVILPNILFEKQEQSSWKYIRRLSQWNIFELELWLESVYSTKNIYKQEIRWQNST